MANHDFNRPCDCRDCREWPKHIECPICKEIHVVVIDRSAVWTTDKHGFTGVDFNDPVGPDKPISCECGHSIEGVGYYSRYDKEATINTRAYQAERAAASKCAVCDSLEGIDRVKGFFEMTKLTMKDGVQLCQKCLSDRVQLETPDPSDEKNKYIFNRKLLSWELDKVKDPCIRCGKSRWLKANNRWKSLCTTCFKTGT